MTRAATPKGAEQFGCCGHSERAFIEDLLNVLSKGNGHN
jgi:hypothetical protein